MVTSLIWHNQTVKLATEKAKMPSSIYAAWKKVIEKVFKVRMAGTEQLKKTVAAKVNLVLASLGTEGQDVFEAFDIPDDVPIERLCRTEVICGRGGEK